MTPKQTADDLFVKFRMRQTGEQEEWECLHQTIACCLVCVNYIIAANPHSNPLNTKIESTMDYWLDVKKEIEKLEKNNL